MIKLILFSLFISLSLVQVSSSKGPLDWLLFKKKPVPEEVTVAPSIDFDALNSYLIEKLEGTNEIDKNLAFVRQNVDSLSGPTQKAAELLLEVSKLDGKCNEHMISLLRQVSETNLKPFGEKRIANVIRQAGLEAALKLCSKYLEQLHENLTGDEKFKLFMFNTPTIFKDGSKKSTLLEFSRSKIIRSLIELSKGDPNALFEYSKANEKTGRLQIIQDKQRFLYALDKYMVEPCRQFNSDPRLVLFLDGALAVSKLGKDGLDVIEILYLYHRLDFKRGICENYINLDAATKANMFP